MSRKIAIVGAGIGGLCTAIALSRQGHTVDIFESATELTETGAGIQLSPNAMHVLENYGLGDALKKLAFEPNFAVLRHYQTGKPYYSIPLLETCEKRFGAKYLHIHRADLHKVMLEAVVASGVQIHLGKAAAAYEQNPKTVSLEFNDGSQHVSDLVIGADGIRSNISMQMLGLEQARYTGHVAWRGVIDASKVPANTIPPDATAWLGPDKHFVSYYVRQGNLINFVAVEERKAWEAENWSQRGDPQELRAAFDTWHPSIKTLLDACDDCYLWGLFDHKPLAKWSDKNVILIGDAAHSMLPFVAQGAAMAIEDSFVLARCLEQETTIPEALIAFEQERKPRTSKVQAMAIENGRLFHKQSGLEGTVNLLKFKLANLAPALAMTKTDFIYSHNVTK